LNCDRISILIAVGFDTLGPRSLESLEKGKSWWILSEKTNVNHRMDVLYHYDVWVFDFHGYLFRDYSYLISLVLQALLGYPLPLVQDSDVVNNSRLLI
jgi:hypothetical protein